MGNTVAAPTGLFQWTSEYSVGVVEIDDQHKVLIDLINRLFLSALNRDHKSAVSEILDLLIDYTRTHFSREEELLGESSYPVLSDHQLQHRLFAEKIEVVAVRYRDGKIVTFELINFLKHWLKEHILGADMGYSAYLEKSSNRLDGGASRAQTVAKKKRVERD
jgi:hemerythrin